METKNKQKKISQVDITFYISLFVAFVFVYSLFGIEQTYKYQAADVDHGPHITSDLSKLVGEEQENGLVTAVKSMFQRNKSVSFDSSAINTASSSISVAPTQQIIDNGYGIAAGGGLVGYTQADLNKYFSELKNLGISWVRWDVDWSYVQSVSSVDYNWADIDRVANTAKSYGIKSLAIITYAPIWAGDLKCVVGKHCSPADPAVFAKFASTVASRYKGVISAYEIWNEQNLSGFWSPKPDVTKYSDVLKQAYIEIKKVDPEVLVLSGGLAAAADDSGSISPIIFVKGLYYLNTKNYFDALALHPYTYPVSPDYIAQWNSWQQMYEIKDIMVSKGDSSKKIWITEYGAPTGGPGLMRDIDQLSFIYSSDYMSQTAQDSMIKKTAEIFYQNRSWLGGFFWYSFRDEGVNVNDPENFFGILRNDWSKKSSYDILKNSILVFRGLKK